MADEKPEREKSKGDETENRELVERPEDDKGLTMAEVLKHPVVKEMVTRMETLQRTLDGLPEAIGRALVEAQKAQRVPGMDLQNPELIAGSPFGKEVPFQDLKGHLEKTRKDVGYKKTPSPPKPDKK